MDAFTSLKVEEVTMKGLVILIAFFAVNIAQADYPTSFSNAKTRAEKEVYFDKYQTFYCKCDFVFDDTNDIDHDGDRKETKIDPQGCGYVARNPITSSGKENKRTSRIEWEHIMPANLIGGHLDQWKNYKNYPACKKSNGKFLNGRDCAYKLVPEFKRAHDDLNNLTPAVGELNGDRSNFNYANIDGESRAYGRCDFEVDFQSDTAEPADDVKGNIARIYFHMAEEHGAKLSTADRVMMEQWGKLDPVDNWECERNRRIEKAQGLGNSFVKSACTVIK
jgi:deoxyribonuclease-1